MNLVNNLFKFIDLISEAESRHHYVKKARVSELDKGIHQCYRYK